MRGNARKGPTRSRAQLERKRREGSKEDDFVYSLFGTFEAPILIWDHAEAHASDMFYLDFQAHA